MITVEETATGQWLATAALTLIVRGRVRWDPKAGTWVTNIYDGYPVQKWCTSVAAQLDTAFESKLFDLASGMVARLTSNGELALMVYLYRALAVAVK